ncbi:methylated-DNA--protein-cysteine methyltransferase [Anopheles sinensis]|uniref:Methylated-DNA--protein-cysteine methyltransferase n=1 Tax=Anopheles sinensis TaxID=74873 RepID=A0A084W1D9_ANOSI|nr:methylated-DNA--protein-cysteine methyltransferase [Anopheles sinensis]
MLIGLFEEKFHRSPENRTTAAGSRRIPVPPVPPDGGPCGSAESREKFTGQALPSLTPRGSENLHFLPNGMGEGKDGGLKHWPGPARIAGIGNVIFDGHQQPPTSSSSSSSPFASRTLRTLSWVGKF